MKNWLMNIFAKKDQAAGRDQAGTKLSVRDQVGTKLSGGKCVKSVESVESVESEKCLKSLKCLMTKNRKTGNIVNIVNIAMQNFKAFICEGSLGMGAVSCAEGRMTEGQQPTNLQGIANISLTVRSMRYAACLLMMLIMGTMNVWGNTITLAQSDIVTTGDDKGKVIATTDHVQFTLVSDGYSIKNGDDGGFEVWHDLPTKSNKDVTLSWKKNIADGDYSISVTSITFKAKAYNGWGPAAGNAKLSFNGGDAIAIGTNTTTASKDFKDFGGVGSYGESVIIKLFNNDGTLKFNFHIKSICITYTVTPDAPELAGESRTTINVTLDEDELDANEPQTIHLPSLFSESGHFREKLIFDWVREDGEYTIDEDSLFFATDTGTYVVRAKYAAISDCHEASSTWSANDTIYVQRLSQTVEWDDEESIQPNIQLGASPTISATASSGLTVAYSSSNTSVLTVNSDGELATVAVGTATITATQEGNENYAPASTTFDFEVKNQATPVFTPSGFDEETTKELYVGQSVTLAVSNVSTGLDGDFTATTDGDGVLQISRIGNTITITAYSEGDVDAIFTQIENDDIFGATKTYSFSISKNAPTITVPSNQTLTVNAEYTASTLSYLNTSKLVPDSGATDHDFYYTISHVLGTEIKKSNVVITFDPSTKEIVAQNAGTATITIYQKATREYSAASSSFTITVNKNTPSITWNSANTPYYYKSSIADIFTTDREGDTTFVSDNEHVAKVMNNTLHIYNVAETAHIQITQAETYYWSRKDTTVTITPVDNLNTIPMPAWSNWTEDTMNTYIISCVDDNGEAWWHDASGNCVEISSGSGSVTDKHMILAFDGIPNELTFKCCASGTDAGSWSILEGATSSTITHEVWTSSYKSKSWSDLQTVQLSPTTRYLKFVHNGKNDARYTEMQISKLAKFETDVEDEIDFGSQGAKYGLQEEFLTFSHANAGRITRAEITGTDAACFSVSPTTIAGTGRDLYGSTALRVTFDNKDNVGRESDPYTATLRISDNAENVIEVPLTGNRWGKTNPTVTFNQHHMPYYLNSTISNFVVSSNTDYTNCPLVFSTTDASVAEVIDGTLYIYDEESEVTIGVTQVANTDFNAVDETITFTPYEKPDLLVPFQVDETILASKSIVASVPDGESASWVSEERAVRLGTGSITPSGWGVRSFMITFGDAPDTLSFTYRTNGTSTTIGWSFAAPEWTVEESSDGSDWSDVWTKSSNSSDGLTVIKRALKNTTRYLQFTYNGNGYGYYRDINITAFDGIKYLLTDEGKYLSRGGAYGTQAVVDDFGTPVRVTRYTTDNENVYTNVKFMDSREYLYETDGGDAVYTDNITASKTKILWEQIGKDGGKVVVQSANGGGKYIMLSAGVLALTDSEESATQWSPENYSLHSTLIDNQVAATVVAAAREEFGESVNTFAKLQKSLTDNDYEAIAQTIDDSDLDEQKGSYATISGTNTIYEKSVSGLAPGLYRVTVQAFCRPTATATAWENRSNGVENVLAYFYANEAKRPIKSIFDGGQGSTGSGTYVSYGGKYYPADKTAAGAIFDAAANNYRSELYVYVEADEGETTGTLEYGIKNPSYVPGAWIAYQSFHVDRLARKENNYTGSEGGDWNTTGNWSRGEVPTITHAVTLTKSVVISAPAEAYSLTIGANKSVTIAPTGGLTVGVGGIDGAGKDNFTLQASDGSDDEELKGQTGYLRVSPDWGGTMPKAQVELYSIAFADDENPTSDTWQYVGVPIVESIDGGTICEYGEQFIYGWSETSSGWFDSYGDILTPFRGYCLTQKNASTGLKFTFNGTLKAPSTEEIPLSYTTAAGDLKGYHVLANSYAAPIDISKFDVDDEDGEVDFVNTAATIFLFNTGSYSETYIVNDDEASSTPGQYIAISPGTAAEIHTEDPTFPVVIPAMQGFCVQATGADATLKLNYRELVWEADYSSHSNTPLRVSARRTEEQETNETNQTNVTDFIKVTLSDGEAADNLYLLASDSYDKSYENGYDAPKMMNGDDDTPNIFAVEDDGQFAIDATSDIEGTFLGVRTGKATDYTLYFSHVNCETEWMLLDIKTNKTTLIQDGASYSFSTKENEQNELIVNRFLIVESDGNAGVATGTEEVTIQNKMQKFIYNDQMYILKDGVLYDARGYVVKR